MDSSSSFRQRWRWIFECRDFIDEVNMYWESLPQEEKDTLLVGHSHEWSLTATYFEETWPDTIEPPTDEIAYMSI